jgi:hypothetical protein
MEVTESSESLVTISLFIPRMLRQEILPKKIGPTLYGVESDSVLQYLKNRNVDNHVYFLRPEDADL